MYKRALAVLATAGTVSFFATAVQAEEVEALDAFMPTADVSLTNLSPSETDRVSLVRPEEQGINWGRRDADARSCSGSFSVGAQRGYFYPYYGVDVADGQPTGQSSISGTCGDFTAELGGSALLFSDKENSRRLANEWWAELAYRPEVKTILGSFRIEAAVKYRGLDHTQGPLAVRDDSTELIAGIGYPIAVGSFELMPYVRSVKSNPVGYNNSLYWMGEGIAVTGPLPGDATFRLDCLDVHNVNSVTAVIHRNVTYCVLEGTKVLPRQGWAFTTGLWVSRYGKHDSKFDLLVERDGRMLRVRKGHVSSTDKFGVNLFGKLTYAF